MALSKSMLRGMGLNDEQVQAIIDAHMESVTGLQNEVDVVTKAKEEAEKKLEKSQKELTQIKKDSEESEGKNPYKVKYDAIKEEFDKYKTDVEAKATKQAKESAYRKLLKDASISDKRIDAILKVSGDTIDGIELDDAGNIKDADKLTESIKTEWSDFIVTERTAGAKTATPPAANNGGVKTKEEIMKIKDTQERQRAWGELIRNGGN